MEDEQAYVDYATLDRPQIDNGGVEGHGQVEEGHYADLTPMMVASGQFQQLQQELPPCNTFEGNGDVYYAYNESGESPVVSNDGTSDSFDQRAEEQFNLYHPFIADGGQYQCADRNSEFVDDQEQDSVPTDPFSERCRIPIPGLVGENGFFDSRTFVRRRNERERARVRNVNEGFERLRKHLPALADDPEPKDKRLSKVETLRNAIDYINQLEDMLQE